MNRTQGGHSPARVSATIRRPDSADLAALTRFFAGLSMQTRVRRFFAPVSPTASLIRLACGWADDDGSRAGGEGRVGGEGRSGGKRSGGEGRTAAVMRTAGPAAPMPWSPRSAASSSGTPWPPTGPPIRPIGPPAAPPGLVTEIGVVVADAWQGQGVGSALVRALISRARARGVTSFSMEVLPGNRDVLAMIAGHWPAARTHRGVDSMTIQAGLAPDEAGLAPDEVGLAPDEAGLALDQPARTRPASMAA